MAPLPTLATYYTSSSLRRDAQATDPRDKVYSLLGLVPGGAPQDLDVDYSLSVDLVYISTAHWLAHQFGWRRVMNHALLREPEVANLPSWAPDWSVPCSQKPGINSGRQFNDMDSVLLKPFMVNWLFIDTPPAP